MVADSGPDKMYQTLSRFEPATPQVDAFQCPSTYGINVIFVKFLNDSDEKKKQVVLGRRGLKNKVR